MRIAAKLRKKINKEKTKKKRQVPRYRISILSLTAFAVQCSTHWAAGNLPCMERKFKDYMEQVEYVLQGTGAQGLCEKLSFWLEIDISKKNYWLFDFITLKFSSVPKHVLNLRVHLERVNLPISGGKPTDTPANILDWYKMGIATKLQKNN